ncbi:lysophospholipid acyltransferase 1-like [Agrilus planipennis]|nr:lysophospholipid acyltransferase 1-like [Agrilus planipennis]
MGTNKWLRMVVYERVQNYPIVLTYALSALWHGFYPGYYLTFANGAIFTIAARTMRRTVRDYFTGNAELKLIYDIATCILTRLVMAYITFTFVLLDFWPSVRLYL